MKERVDLRLSTQSEQYSALTFLVEDGGNEHRAFSPTPVWLFQLAVPNIFQGKRRRLGKEKKVCMVCVCAHVAPLHAHGALVEIHTSLLAGINGREYWAGHKLQES